jgi:hypothetical protein
MRIHRLIPTVVVLFILAAATMTTFQHPLVSVESGTASAQQAISAEPVQADGLTSIAASETKDDIDTDLYLDADEVEKRAAAEQSGDSDTSTSPSRIPVSFKHVPIPLPGGIDHAVAGVGTRNSGQGVIRLRGVPAGSTLINAFLIWGEITNNPNPYNVAFGPDCALGATFTGQVYGTTTGTGMTASRSTSYGIRIPMCLGMALSLLRAAGFNTACDTYRRETVSSGLRTFSVFVS